MGDESAPIRLQDKTMPGIVEHWCMHPGCKAWGSFGFAGRYGVEWYCGKHRADAFMRDDQGYSLAEKP
ncbi:hypothetical protein [Phyllobacterium phragmitis]|uniref:hypothetical protein n=1 Tax=Phyllobacterium phragmitis TaxID=2670329 RepID=UPI0038B257E0